MKYFYVNLAIHSGNNMQIILFRLKHDQNVHTKRERERQREGGSRKIFIILIISDWSGKIIYK